MKIILDSSADPLPMEVPEFSLVLGGALFQLYRRTRLSGEALERLYLQAILFTLIAWFPLLLLSFLSRGSRHTWRGDGSAISTRHGSECKVSGRGFPSLSLRNWGCSSG